MGVAVDVLDVTARGSATAGRTANRAAALDDKQAGGRRDAGRLVSSQHVGHGRPGAEGNWYGPRAAGSLLRRAVLEACLRDADAHHERTPGRGWPCSCHNLRTASVDGAVHAAVYQPPDDGLGPAALRFGPDVWDG